MIQFITQGKTPKEHLQNAQLALDSGIRWIQLRLKDYPEEEVTSYAEEFLNICSPYDVVPCLNDYAEVAASLNFPALHLGKKDEDPKNARARFSKDVQIGGTTNTWSDIKQIHPMVDYIGLGPLRFTTTKEVLSPILGLEGYKDIIGKMREHDIDLPVIAIGGITVEDAMPLAEIGLAGIAISGYLIETTFNKQHIRRMQEAFSESKYQETWIN